MQTDSYKDNRRSKLKEKYGSETFNNPIKTKNTRINNNRDDDIYKLKFYKMPLIKQLLCIEIIKH